MRPQRVLFEEFGQATVLAAVGVAVILSFLGLAIDVGQLRYAKRNLQMTADAAALAGALEIQSCHGTANCTAMQTAAQNALVENGLNNSQLVTNCGPVGSSGLTVMVNNGPCLLGSTNPGNGKTNYVEVQISQAQPLNFARFVGLTSVALSARSQAMRSNSNVCMYALDPTGSSAITVDVAAAVVANCGMVDESSSSSAFSCNLLATVKVPSIKVAGGKEKFLCGTSTVTTGAMMPTPRDPLAYLPKPSVTSCGTGSGNTYHGSSSALNLILGSYTLYPDGAYCGGINIAPTASVTFMPGTYVLTSNNTCGGLLQAGCGLTMDVGSWVSGKGVTFYNYGPKGGVNFVATLGLVGAVDLEAPTTGTYSGVLFFQDPGNTSSSTILASVGLGGLLNGLLQGTKLQGVNYFPTARVNYAASGMADYSTLIAYDIDFIAASIGTTPITSGFGTNYSSLAGGNPAAGNGAVLVQ